MSQSLAEKDPEITNDLVFSYQAMKNFVGFSGMLLAIVLILFTKRETTDGPAVAPSISDYFYTSAGD